MAENETRVTYRAVADFVSFIRAVDRAKQKLRELRKEEAALNAETVAGEGRAANARGKHVGEMSQQARALEDIARGADKAAAANSRHAASSDRAAASSDRWASAINRGAQSTVRFRDETSRAQNAIESTSASLGRAEGSARRLSSGVDAGASRWSRYGRAAQSAGRDIGGVQGVAARVTGQLGKLQKNLDRLRDWRPRLIPPFIALVPVIASLLALVNPLVAGFGSIVPVALGFASSLGTLAGAALGAAPALAGLLSTVFALKTAFGGIGGAFKAFGKTPAGGGKVGGGGGAAKADKPIEITQTEKITRANEDYRRSIQDVQFAEDDLSDARKDYIKRVQELQKAVDRYAQSQARASANTRLAQENYANVLADPGSTKGQKMDAAAGVQEAMDAQTDLVDQNKQDQADLAALKKTGINGDRQVIMSQRAVTDAIDAQRDAQIALQNAIKGTSDAATGGGGGASAIDAYNAALAKLSPSARKFVEAIVAMKPELDKLKRTVQEAFFSQFVGDIELLRKLFPPVTSLLSDVAAAAGRVADKFLLLVTNDSWTSDIVEFGKLFAPILEDIGDAFLALLDGFRNLTIAVTPFLGRVAKRFKEFSENLRDTLGAARADGSLAAYMDRVAAAWDQWWRIIKNVGKTLMGYSKASSDFGQWLTDGLEKLTESWVKNSDDAQKQGSGYKQWLEDLMPLLKEVKGLFGDFFGYLHDEATDPENIKQFTDLVKILREEVGPALKRILDALSKSGIGEGLVKAIGSILGALATFLENGGAEGMAAFFDVISGLAKAVGDFVGALPEPVVKYITEGFAILAALTFVGLNLLIGNLMRLGASKGLMSVLRLLPNFSKIKEGIGRLGGLFGRGAGAAAGAAGGSAAGSAAGGAAGLGAASAARGALGAAGPRIVGADQGPQVFSRPGGLFGRGGAANITSLGREAGPASKVLKALGTGAKFLGKGNIAGIAGAIAGGAISATAAKGKDGGTQRTTGGIVSGAATGAGLGAAVGSVVPGVGTAVGAAVGGVAGGAAGFFTAKPEDKKKFLDDISNFFTTTVPNTIKNLGSGIWEGLKTFGQWLTDMWEGAKDWLQNLPRNIAFTAGAIWGNIQNFGDWLVEKWNDAVDWVKGLPRRIADTASDIWQNIKDFGTWIAEKWVAAAEWVRGLPKRIANTAKDIWNNLPAFWDWLVKKWNDAKDWVAGLPQRIADAAGDLWSNLGDIGAWLGTQLTKVKNWAQGLAGKIGNWVGNAFSGIGGAFNAGENSTRNKKNKNSGGIIRRAGGGTVPGRGNGDTVPAMLTPGEFVTRKSIVKRIGVENFQRLNSGMMSFGQMLTRAQQERPGRDSGMSDGVSFLNGGGLVPQLSSASSAKMSQVATQQAQVSNDYSMHFGDIIVNNPVAEKSSDSLPKAIRRTAALGSLRRDKKE